MSTQSLTQDLVADAEARLAGPNDAVMTLSTSGSTGIPRLVRRTVGSWRASLDPLARIIGLGDDDVVWATGPSASTMTRYAVWQAVAAGIPVTVTGPWRGVPAHAGQATVAHCVPVVAEALARAAHRQHRGVTRWRLRALVVAGGAPRPGLRQRAADAGLTLIEYYGAAELSFVGIDVDGRGLLPFPGVEVQICEGALRARSGYLAESVDGRPVAGADGWASVGDRARWSGSGRFRVLGRAGAATVGGTTVHLAEVEAVLAETPGVQEVVCAAVPDGLLGERVVAMVHPLPGHDPVPALRRTALRLAPAARPTRHLVADALPRLKGGKVDRTALPGLFAGNRGA